MNPFDHDIGIHQGRIPASDAPDGAYVYELGHALMAEANCAIGDNHVVGQVLTLSPQTHFLRASIRLRVPDGLPVGAAWQFTADLNGVVFYTRRIHAAELELELDDLRVSTAGANFTPLGDTLAFKLELVA